jgi:hypothetical protein
MIGYALRLEELWVSAGERSFSFGKVAGTGKTGPS